MSVHIVFENMLRSDWSSRDAVFNIFFNALEGCRAPAISGATMCF
jgi:hypothetical protein